MSSINRLFACFAFVGYGFHMLVAATALKPGSTSDGAKGFVSSKAFTALLLALNAKPAFKILPYSFPSDSSVERKTRLDYNAALMRIDSNREPAIAGIGPSTTKAKKLGNARTTQIQAQEPGLVRGVGAGRDLPAPSGINTLSLPLQKAVSIGILWAICLGSGILAGPVFDALRGSSVWNLSRPTWPALGLIYLVAGIAHFTELEGFENITPPNGTWGWFYSPFSPRFNVIWTGIVEIFGGGWMLFGALAPLLGFELPASLGPVDSASILFLLTVLVTPANIYALTHGANFPLDLEVPPKAHAVRLVFQSVLLAMFLEMSQTL